MGTILQEATRVTCDARVGEAAGHFGFAPLWCNVQRGLRSYTDVAATVRRFCPRHEAVVRSRYPEGRPSVLSAREEREEMLADRELMADEFHGQSW